MSTDPTFKGLRREPKAVTKPRVGNPWRESVHGPVGVPVMRVRGGAPNGMPVPSWQADGSPREPREVPVNGAPELPSIVRAYALDAPVLSYQESTTREASRAYVVSRPAASVAEDRADGSWQTTPDKCASMREEHAIKVWSALCVRMLSAGQCALESLPLHPSIVAERTRALQSREAPSYVVVRALPSAPMAHDPGHQTRAILAAVAPVKGHRYRVRNGLPPVLSALSALLPDKVDAREGVSGGFYRHKGELAAGSGSCAWCDSIACDRARDESLHCKVYDRAVSRGMPEAVSYVQAREAFKGPRRAHRAALEWIEDGRQATVSLLRRLDSRGVSIDHDRGAYALHDGTDKGRQAARGAFHGTWRVAPRECGARASGGVCVLYTRAVPRQYLTACLDGAHWRLARWEYLRECLSTATADALSSIIEDAPRGVWWASELPRWRTTRDAHNGAVGALAQALRATRDTTVARVVPSQWEDTVKRVVRPSPDGAEARASSVVAAPREKIAPASPPKPAPLPRVVTEDAPKRPARHWGDAPAYPVTPRKRTGDDASQCAPYAGRPIDGRTAQSIAAPPIAPPRELPMIRLHWCGAAPASGRWIEPLRFARTPRPPRR